MRRSASCKALRCLARRLNSNGAHWCLYRRRPLGYSSLARVFMSSATLIIIARMVLQAQRQLVTTGCEARGGATILGNGTCGRADSVKFPRFKVWRIVWRRLPLKQVLRWVDLRVKCSVSSTDGRKRDHWGLHERCKDLRAVRLWVVLLLDPHLLTVEISNTTVLGARMSSESRHARTIRPYGSNSWQQRLRLICKAAGRYPDGSLCQQDEDSGKM